MSTVPAASERDGGDPAAQAQLRINVRPLASSLPLGLFCFGVGMLLLAAQTGNWIPTGEAKQMGFVLATFVFPLEVLAATMAFLARDTLAAISFGLFSTSWLTVGVVLITGKPGATSDTLGFYLLAFAAPVVSLSAAAMAGKPLIGSVLMLSAARSILARQQTVWPVFRRGSGREAIEGGLTEQLERARSEAGVRQQL